MRSSGQDGQSKMNLIAEWKASGLSQKEFYQQRNIPAHVFYYWHKCYRDHFNKAQGRSSSTAGDFVELSASLGCSATASVEVHLPNGVRVVFNGSVSPEYLKALIR